MYSIVLGSSYLSPSSVIGRAAWGSASRSGKDPHGKGAECSHCSWLLHRGNYPLPLLTHPGTVNGMSRKEESCPNCNFARVGGTANQGWCLSGDCAFTWDRNPN